MCIAFSSFSFCIPTDGVILSPAKKKKKKTTALEGFLRLTGKQSVSSKVSGSGLYNFIKKRPRHECFIRSSTQFFKIDRIFDRLSALGHLFKSKSFW